MAKNKAKRSNPLAQPLRRRPHPAKPVVAVSRRLCRFPQVKGKTVGDVEFSTDHDYHSISLNFQDKTCLNFVIDTGFTLEATYSDWKTGNQRLLRRWPRMRSRD